MAETISKHIGEGFGKGELYAALAYDATDSFGGMKIKNVMFNSTGKAYFLDANAYIYASSSGVLELTATTINLNGAFAFTGSDKLALGTSAAPLTLTAGSPVLTVYTTNAGTSGSTNAENVLFNSVMTGAGQVGARVFVNMSTNVVLGSWANAFKAQVQNNTNGGSAGVLSVACLEMYFPASAGSGLYDILELEANCPTGWVGASPSLFSYINCNQSGNTKANWDTVGNLFRISNATAASGKFIYNDTIRILLDATSKYIPLSTAEGSFTTSYPIVTTYATTAISIATCTTGISIVAPTTGILLTGAMTTGISMPGGQDYTPMIVGVKSSTAGIGFKVAGSGDDSGGVQLYGDDAGVAAAGEVISPFRSRYMLTVNQSGGVTQTALFAQLVSGGSGTRTYTTGGFRAAYVFNQQGTTTLVTSAEVTGINQATTLAGTMTVGSGCSFTGIDINIAGAGAMTGDGTMAGLLIRASGTPVWANGILIPSGDALTGISIGSCATAGINIEGTHTLALGIGSTTALTTATTAMSAVKVQSAFSATTGYHVGAWFVGNYTGAGAAGGSVYALRGHVAVTGTQTTVGAEAFIVGVHGRCAVTGTAYNSSAVYAGVLAQMLGGGTWTAANKVYALWVDNQLATNPTSGTVAMVGIRQNNNSGTAVVDHVFDIYGANIANFINFDSCISSGFVSSGSVGSTAIHKTACKTIKILIDGVDYYLIASTVVESS